MFGKKRQTLRERYLAKQQDFGEAVASRTPTSWT